MAHQEDVDVAPAAPGIAVQGKGGGGALAGVEGVEPGGGGLLHSGVGEAGLLQGEEAGDQLAVGGQAPEGFGDLGFGVAEVGSQLLGHIRGQAAAGDDGAVAYLEVL